MADENFTNEWIKSTLEGIGYKLQDNGDHWRSSAVYRQGKNHNSVIVFKKSGVWSDYGLGEGFKPLYALVEATIGEVEARKMFVNQGNGAAKPADFFIEMNTPEYDLSVEKTYPASYLDSLLPYLDFYLSKGISKDTLKKTKCGYATGHEMLKRMTFPIYNKLGQIHGLAGRDIFWDANSKKPKWKNMGKTKNWVYPANQPSFGDVVAEINSKRSVRIVESIGDSLALIELGQLNHAVSFGLEIKSGLISFLNTLDINEVILSLNNDERNNGQIAMAKQFIKLSEFFDIQNLAIEIPIEGDCMDCYEKFGEVRFETKLKGKDCLPFIKKNLVKPTQEERKFIKKYE